MLAVVAAALLWLPALVGLGSALPLSRDPGLRRGIAGVLGLGVLGVMVMVVQLAVPFGPPASACAFLAGLVLLFLRRSALREGLGASELAGGALAVVLALAWYQAPHTTYDSGLYYLQTVRWITEHPVRLGLANLHGRLAFNSLWLLVAGGLELPLLSGRSFAFAGVIPLALTGGLAGVGLWRLAAGRGSAGDAGLALLAPVVGHATYGVGAASPDQAAELLVVLALVLWVRAQEGDDQAFASDARPALLVAIFATLVKLSAAPVLLAPAAALVLRRRAISPGWIARLLLPCAAAIVPWVARSVLLSGCAVYPLVQACTFEVPWSVPLEAVRREAAWIRSWARTPLRSPAEVLGGWEWLPGWAARTARRSDVRMFGATAGAGLALAGWARPSGPGLPIALGTAAAGVAYSFLSAPDPRFAFGFLHALGLLPLAFSLVRLPRRRCGVSCLLLLAAVAALTLRWARIGHQRVPWRLDPFEFPGPPAAEVVERTNRLGTRVWVPVHGDQCWDAPLPCAPSLGESLQDAGGRYAILPSP